VDEVAMDKWKTIVGILLIFVMGALSGGLGTGWYLKSRHDKFWKDPERRVEFIMQRLGDRLDLTEIQKPAVEAVVRRMDEAMQRQFEQRRAEMRRIFDDQDAAIKPLLTLEQQEKYAAFRRELEARRKDRKGS
jgi:hypothetical protein